MSSRILRIAPIVLTAALCGSALVGRGASAQSAPSPGAARADRAPGTAREPRGASTDPHADLFLVVPFENESKMASLDWLGEGFAELTLERLADRGENVLSREDRLATLERMGLPDSARFSHATIVKIAGEADADAVVYGRFQSDGKTVTFEARVLRLNPPSLSPSFMQTAALADLTRAHARIAWQILCALDKKQCPAQGANTDETSFSEPPASLRVDALENYVRGVVASSDDERLRLLREAARLEPAWDRPAFELGQIYFKRHDCDSALVWYSRVPPGRQDGPEATFSTGVCHLTRNDAARAEATFSGLLDRARKPGEKGSLPELPEMHNNLGVARLRMAKWADADTEFEKAAALDSEEADYWVNSAIAKLAAKQNAAAVAPLERARNIDPDDKDARTLLIAALESLGRGQDAAAIRAQGADGAEKPSKLNLQDAPGLARMARVSKNMDRSLLRPGAEVPEGQSPAGKGPQKIDRAPANP